jgi:hypothetical protein
MLFHVIECWPVAVTIDLWPFALKMAVDLYNATPGPSGLSPEEIFSRQKNHSDRLVDFHTFGCLVVVLDPSLQQGHKIPKWQPRARQAVRGQSGRVLYWESGFSLVFLFCMATYVSPYVP